MLESIWKSLPPSRQRSLTPPEKRLLSLQIADLESQRNRGSRVFALAGITVAALWLSTLVASDSSAIVVTVFWTMFALLLAAWIYRDIRRERRFIDQQLAGLHSAKKANRADVYDIKARAFIEFEEFDDEGACFAFDLGDGQVVFVVGQEYYPSAKFPSHDFSLIYVLDERGNTVGAHIEKRDEQRAPLRIVPADRQRNLSIPEHLQVVQTSLDRLEASLETLRE